MLFEILKWFLIGICGFGSLWLIHYLIHEQTDEMKDDYDKSRIGFFTFADVHLSNMAFAIMVVLGISSVGVYYQLSPDTQKTVVSFFERIENYFDHNSFAHNNSR